MINKITITNHLGESTTIELRFPEKSGFLIRGIDGLSPSKANINTNEISSGDGSIYNSARVSLRNIVLSLVFMEHPTIEDTRRNSYKYFPIKKHIGISIETDSRICLTDGYVESNEVNIFSREEGSTISVICPDPYFYSSDIQITEFGTVESEFEFPFSNESLVDKLIEFGNILINTERTIVYDGDAEIGVLMFIHALGSVNDLSIINTKTLERMDILSDRIITLTGSDIIAGDDIIISTVKGNKFITLLRGGVPYNILNALDKNADWFQLQKGDNVFAFIADSGVSNLQFRVENQIAYEGA